MLGVGANLGSSLTVEMIRACRRHGKAAGILLPRLDLLPRWIAKRFTFLVFGSNGGALRRV